MFVKTFGAIVVVTLVAVAVTHIVVMLVVVVTLVVVVVGTPLAVVVRLRGCCPKLLASPRAAGASETGMGETANKIMFSRANFPPPVFGASPAPPEQ